MLRILSTPSVCNANGDPVPGPRPFPLFAQVKFPWRDAVDTVEEISSYESYRLSMLLSREGLICGPSSGMTLQGLYNFLQNHKDRGNLHSLAGPDGNVCCVFMCCDLPYQYLDDYFAKLGEDQFRPIVNEVYVLHPVLTINTNPLRRISSTPTCTCMTMGGKLSLPPQ